MKQGVWPAIEKFQSDVAAHISEHGVITHPQCILGVVAAGIPGVDGSHRAGIRGDERRKRKNTTAIVAAASCKSRDHGMAEAREHALALTTVVQRVFLEDLCQPIAR